MLKLFAAAALASTLSEQQREAAAAQAGADTNASADAYLSGEVTPPSTPAVLREQIIDAQGRAYATGRRKDAVARVWLKPGTGKITINGRDQ